MVHEMPEPEFVDDFSSADLARYYEIHPGIGTIERGTRGLEFQILRAPDGGASSADHLSIDSLGRPQTPTTKAVFRFTGTAWRLEAHSRLDLRRVLTVPRRGSPPIVRSTSYSDFKLRTWFLKRSENSIV